jgi:hypothetical protein
MERSRGVGQESIDGLLVSFGVRTATELGIDI